MLCCLGTLDYHRNVLEMYTLCVIFMQGTAMLMVEPPITFVERDSVYPKAKESPSTAVHQLLGDLCLCEFQENKKS